MACYPGVIISPECACPVVGPSVYINPWRGVVVRVDIINKNIIIISDKLLQAQIKDRQAGPRGLYCTNNDLTWVSCGIVFININCSKVF